MQFRPLHEPKLRSGSLMSLALMIMLVLASILVASCASPKEEKLLGVLMRGQGDWARTCAPAYYPGNARFMGTYGTTVVFAEIARDGKVTNAVISKSSGNSNEHKELDQATLTHVKSCVFQKKPVHAFETREIRFTWLLTP